MKKLRVIDLKTKPIVDKINELLQVLADKGIIELEDSNLSSKENNDNITNEGE